MIVPDIIPSVTVVNAAKQARLLLTMFGTAAADADQALALERALSTVVQWAAIYIPSATAIWTTASEGSLVLTSGDDRLAGLAGDCALLVEFERRFIHQQTDGDSHDDRLPDL